MSQPDSCTRFRYVALLSTILIRKVLVDIDRSRSYPLNQFHHFIFHTATIALHAITQSLSLAKVTLVLTLESLIDMVQANTKHPTAKLVLDCRHS